MGEKATGGTAEVICCPHCNEPLGGLSPFRSRLVDAVVAGAPTGRAAALIAGSTPISAAVTASRALQAANVQSEIVRRRSNKLDKASALKALAYAQVRKHIGKDAVYDLKALEIAHRMTSDESKGEDSTVQAEDRGRFLLFLQQVQVNAVNYTLKSEDRATIWRDFLADQIAMAAATAHLPRK